MIGGEIVWGIDIGGSAVKGVKLRRVIPRLTWRMRRGAKQPPPERLEILAADVVPIRDAPRTGEINPRHPRVVAALAEFQARNRIREERVAIAVPGSLAFVRPFDIMRISDAPIEELVRYEVQQLIPFGLDAVLWGYDLFPVQEGDSRRQEGLLFAVKKETVNGYLLALNLADVEVDEVQVAPLAMLNLIRMIDPSPGPLLAIDIGATCTDLVAIHSGRYWVRSAPFGGHMITEAMAREFELTFEKAEAVKQNIGRSKFARKIIEKLLPCLRAYVGELQNVLNPLRKELKPFRFDKIYLFGKGARTVGLKKLISQNIEGTVVTPADLSPLLLAPSVNAERIREELPALAVAMGLAIQCTGKGTSKVSFAIEGAARRRLVSRTQPVAAATLGVLTLLLGSVLGFGYYRHESLRKIASSAQNVIAAITANQKKLSEIQRPTKLQEQMEELRQLGIYRGAWFMALGELMRFMPDNQSTVLAPTQKVWITDLDMRRLSPSHLECKVGVAVVNSGWKSRDEMRQFLEKTLVQPLKNHPQFRRVSAVPLNPITRLSRGSMVSPGSKDARYYLFDMTFEFDAAITPSFSKKLPEEKDQADGSAGKPKPSGN